MKRLFDCIEHQLKNHPLPDMLVSKVGGEWKKYSTSEVRDIVNNFSAGLLQAGFSGKDKDAVHSDKIAVISSNRPEWIFTDLAVQQIGCILVPLYPTLSDEEIVFTITHAGVRCIFVGDQTLLEKIKRVQHLMPLLEQIYTYDEIHGETHWMYLTTLATPELLAKVEEIKAIVPVSHTATIIYTSGTSGKPKGVMLSHENIYSNVELSVQSFQFNRKEFKRVLSFLPLNHSFEKMLAYTYMFTCISIYYAEKLELIANNLREIKPYGFGTVPRLLEKMYEVIVAKGNTLKGLKRKLFFKALHIAEVYNPQQKHSLKYSLQLWVMNYLVFRKWRDALGGNIRFIVTGGAACKMKILRVFNAAKIPVYEGYGPTENSPVIAVNRRTYKGMYFGTVGPVIDGIQVRLARDGEILVSGSCVMQGYYNDPATTGEVLLNGWLHTGDIGTFVHTPQHNFLKITDRKKELFKTSGGKYIASQVLENTYRESSFIEQIMVVGDNRKFVGALIVPSFRQLCEWMKANQIEYTNNSDAIKHPLVLEKYRVIINKYSQHLSHYERVKRFALLHHEWSVNGGELTPKLSLRRRIIAEKFKIEIDEIYNVDKSVGYDN